MTRVIRPKALYIKKLWGFKITKKNNTKKSKIKKNTIKIINVTIAIKNKLKGNNKF